jgi:branched-chain amino acid transport system ATP-binding protein
MAELELDGVTLRFGGLTALQSVSLSVQAGELLALIGPNGAGKTSIFNCISGLYRPEGEIRFRGRNICGSKPHHIASLGIARTFQHAELFPQMTVLDNVMTGRHPRMQSNVFIEMLRMPSARREEEQHRAVAEGILDFVELRTYRDVAVGGLSFGLQKIIGFARALVAQPLLLLLDEPSAGLVREEREDLAYFILKTREKFGTAIIWIEHDMQMVADLANRIHVLDYGRSLADGSPEAVLREESVIRAYLGTGTKLNRMRADAGIRDQAR